jgi:CBS domain-containing protein
VTVRDVMTTKVVTVDAGATLAEAAEILTRNRISGMPVVANGLLVGVLSEGDLLRYIRREVPVWERYMAAEMFLYLPSEPDLANRLRELRGHRVSTVMSRPAVTVGADEALDEAAALLLRRRIKRVPVVEDGRLVGIVTRLDLVRALLPPSEGGA